ncbi:MAG: hypothetical protein O2946_13900, partial [Planctomycetota bacterium]|nr:hypothetical protein [Planctomycetota bacterium]
PGEPGGVACGSSTPLPKAVTTGRGSPLLTPLIRHRAHGFAGNRPVGYICEVTAGERVGSAEELG